MRGTPPGQAWHAWRAPGRLTPAELGAVGEAFAARRLKRAGLTLLDRRVRTPFAEVDLVLAAGDGTLVLCEVKTARVARDGRGPRPGELLTHRQRRRLTRAGRWLAARRAARSRPGLGAGWRLDVGEVSLTHEGRVHWRHTVGRRQP